MSTKHVLAGSEPYQTEHVVEWRLILGQHDRCPILQARNVGAGDWVHILTVNDLGQLDPTFHPGTAVKGLAITTRGWIEACDMFMNPEDHDD